MNIAESILKLRPVFITLAAILVLSGVIAYFTMPIEEDPRLKERNGIITIVYPGANTREIERLIARPVEDRLADIGALQRVDTTSRPQVMIARLELRDALSETSEINEAWQEVRTALDEAALEFPDGVEPYELNRKVIDIEAIVLAVTGSESLLELRDAADELRERLLRLPQVSGVNLVADPGEEISIDLDDRTLRARGLSYGAISQQLFESNRAVPAGAVRLGDRAVAVRTNASFVEIDEIRSFPVLLESGDVLALGQLADIERTVKRPRAQAMFYNGETAVGLGVIPRRQLNLIRFGDSVRAELDQFNRELTERAEITERQPLRVENVNFQPDYVRERIASLGVSLLSGIAIVGGVLLLAMGLRVGLLTAILVPVISAIALAVYAAGDGVLHQISIAAFVLALGLLIDNVIVIVENMQELIDAGSDGLSAAAQTVREFALPLATATGTTIAAFLPMFGASGATADFTRAIPLIAMLTLSVSYLFSIFVTPALAVYVLKPGAARSWNFTHSLGALFGSLVVRRPGRVLLMASGVLALAGFCFTLVSSKFFPAADRNQVVVDLRLAEGTHIQTTSQRALELAESMRAVAGVTRVTVFVGRSTPPFYYNLTRAPRSSHIAQMIVELDSFQLTPRLRGELERLGREAIFDGTLVVRELQQGPPTRAPIEILVLGDDHAAAGEASNRIVRALRELPGTDAVRSDFGLGLPQLKFQIGDANALQFGLARGQVTGVLLGRTRGLEVGQFRGGEADALPIMLRSPRGEELSYDELYGTYVGRTRVADINIADLAAPELEWQPAVLNHRNGSRMVRVLAELRSGASVPEVVGQFQTRLPQLGLPEGVRVEYGGEQAESGNANQAIARALPAGIALLLVSLLIEFRSFKKVAIILIAVPLAMVGVAPGLVLAGQPFGFLSLLGSLALAGIVANNGILLIGAADQRIREGDDAEAALQSAIGRRMRPILLTTLTTIAGMLPLAFTSATLWPPFAWAIISGLSVSTVLTIFVVPALYRLWILRGAGAANSGSDATARAAGLTNAGALVMVLLLSAIVFAAMPGGELIAESAKANAHSGAGSESPEPDRVSLGEVLLESGDAPGVQAAYARSVAAGAQAETLSRATYYPKVGAGLNYELRDRKLRGPEILPGLTVANQPRQIPGAGVEVVQPLLDPASMWYYVPAAAERAEAAGLSAQRERQAAMADGANRYFEALRLRVRLSALQRFQNTLYKRRQEIRRLFEFGRVARIDLLRVDLALNDARQGLVALRAGIPVADLALAQAMGRDVTVTPAALSGSPRMPVIEFEEARKTALEQRVDLAALRAQIRAKELERTGLEYEVLPKVFLKGQWTYIENGQLQDNNWFSFSVGMTMPIFEGGTRKLRGEALDAELQALQSQRTQIVQGIGVQVREAMADITTARSELKQNAAAVAAATRTAGLAAQRYRQGRGQLNELLDAETLLRKRRERRDLARIDLQAALIHFELVTGQDPGSMM